MQITFREDWNDPRLAYNDYQGTCHISSDTIKMDDILKNMYVSSRKTQVFDNDGNRPRLDARHIFSSELVPDVSTLG